MSFTAGFFTALAVSDTPLSRSAAKIIDTVGEQIGLTLKPLHTRRQADADAYAAKIKAKTKAEVKVIEVAGKLYVESLPDRTAQRVQRLNERRQENLEATIAHALNEHQDSVSEAPVDPDWVSQFLNHAQDVSNDDMRHLWGRILAGEVAKPGSFSLRTMAAVRVLSRENADLFTKYCSFVWNTDTTPSSHYALKKYGVTTRLEMELMALGLIIEVPMLKTFMLKPNAKESYEMSYFGRKFRLSTPVLQPESHLYMGKFILSDIGRELAPIAGGQPNEEYLSDFLAKLKTDGWTINELPVENHPVQEPTTT